MVKIKKIKLNKFASTLKKFPKFLAERAFLAILFLLIAAFLLGSLFFYKYGVLAKRAKQDSLGAGLLFEEKTFQEVLKIWQEKEKRFKEAEEKSYPDPFK